MVDCVHQLLKQLQTVLIEHCIFAFLLNLKGFDFRKKGCPILGFEPKTHKITPCQAHSEMLHLVMMAQIKLVRDVSIKKF